MRPAWSGSDLAALTEQITREVTRQLDPSGSARPPRKRSSTRDIPSDPHRAGVIAPDESGARAGSVEFDPHPQPEPRTPPPYEEPGPYPGLGQHGDAGSYDAPARTLGQPAPRAARWTPGTMREESGPKSAIAGPSWSPPLSTPEPEPRDSDPVWQPPEWLTPPKRQPSPPESAELPSWSPPPLAPPSPGPKPTWAPPAPQLQTPPVPAVAWSPPAPQPQATRPAEPALPAQAIRPSAVAPSEDEFVDGGFASEFDDDEFDDGPGSEDDFPPLDLAAQSGRHRKRRRRLDQPAIEIPQAAVPSASLGHSPAASVLHPVATPLPPIDALGDDDDFADEPVAAKPKPAPAPAPASKSERPKAKQPRDDDDDDDDFDDDEDDDDFGDDDEDEDPAANSSSQLGASVTAPKDKGPGRKLPWVAIAAVSGGLVLVLAFAFRDTLFGPGDDATAVDAVEDDSEGAEPAAEPDPEPVAEDKVEPAPQPEPKPPAIPTEELDAKIAEATSLVNRQKFDDARVILDEVLAKIPNEGRALALLAQTQLEKNKLEEALATANDCVAADPGQAFCWIIIATVEQGNDNLPRALEAYRKYLEVEPDGQHAKSAKKQVTRLEGKVQG